MMGWQDAPKVGQQSTAAAPAANAPKWAQAPKAAEKSASPYPDAINLNPAVAQAEATAALGSGAVAGPVSGFAGIAGAVLPGPQGQGADWAQRTASAMTYEPRTTGGQVLTGAVTAPFEMLAKGADYAGRAATDAAARVLPAERTSPAHAFVPTAPEVGTLVNAGLQAAPMAVGRVAPKVAAPLVPEGNAATRAGFRVTPQEGGGGVIQNNMATLAGEPRLARRMSNENAGRVHDAIVRDLGLDEGTTITRDVLERVRDKHGAAYEKLRSAGEVRIDQQFMSELQQSVRDRQTAARDFPRGSDPIMEMYSRMVRNADGSVKRSFDASSAVSEIKNLRKEAKSDFARQDFETGGAKMDAAAALERILDRHVEKLAIGNEYVHPSLRTSPEAVKEFKEARKIIAKTYDAEKALVRDGTLDPQVYARLYKQGKLSGGALEVGEAAWAAPRSLAKPNTQGIGASFADIGLAVLESLKGSGGLTLPMLLARPAARTVMASGPYQSAITRGGLAEALASEAAGQALPLAAYGGLAGNRTLGEIQADAAAESFPPNRGAPRNRVGGGTR